MSYKQSEAYKWYLDGEDGNRHAQLPPFELNDAGEIKVAPGEVYCRFMMDGTLCPVVKRFSNESNLKSHVKKHLVGGVPVKIKGKRQGANNIQENFEAINFYKNLKRAIEHLDKDQVLEVPPTPSKLPATHPDAPTPLVDKRPKLPVTKTKPYRPKYGEMRKGAGLKGQAKCDGCKDLKRTECPPIFRDNSCQVWLRYRVHGIEEELTEEIARPRRKGDKDDKAAPGEGDAAGEGSGGDK
ncbi:hypothetical protein C7999DRAFT_27077 [Corynascus novoguineensis]|uniref:Uncharacterized protein n=1 Tax=Corynascus novoguineensis TaxID=1126955 RepID=A0AAN7HV71_9PEZI|nr:hypothetical protein C7999DRAFT_27077 [Corynascus novoguineensis]